MINPNDPAFPDPSRAAPSTFSHQAPLDQPSGMTIRAEIASRCMNGLIGYFQDQRAGDSAMTRAEYVAQLAVEYADALIARLNQ